MNVQTQASLLKNNKVKLSKTCLEATEPLEPGGNCTAISARYSEKRGRNSITTLWWVKNGTKISKIKI